MENENQATEEKPVVVKDIKNGVTRPRDGSKTGAVWDIADRISAAASRPALREEVMAEALDAGLNKGTIATQYARWTDFHGVSKADRKAVRDASKPEPVEAPATDEAAE